MWAVTVSFAISIVENSRGLGINFEGNLRFRHQLAVFLKHAYDKEVYFFQ